MSAGAKRVTFAKYNLKKWHPSVEIEYKKTPRTEKKSEIIDMRELPPIEEELVKTHENTYSNFKVSNQTLSEVTEHVLNM